MKWIALIFVLVALVIIAGTGWIYFNALGKPFTAITIDDWTSFGTYFGGTAGPLLAFLTVAGLVLTLLMQNHQLEQVAQGDLKDKHVRMLIEIGRDLEAMEAQHLTSDVTLGNVLNGASSLPSSGEQVFRTTLQSYVKVLGYFAQSVECIGTISRRTSIAALSSSADCGCWRVSSRMCGTLDRWEARAL